MDRDSPIVRTGVPTGKGSAYLITGISGVTATAPFTNRHQRDGGRTIERHPIASNFYYVGASDVAAFLTGPEGHVVLDGGDPTTARLIMASIAKLGFDIKDVKVLLKTVGDMKGDGDMKGLSVN